MTGRGDVRTPKMDASLKEFLTSVIQSLPVSTGLAATVMSVMSAVLVAYKWNRTKNEKHTDDVNTIESRNDEKNHPEDQINEREILQKKLENGLKTARRDLEANEVETDGKQRPKNEEEEGTNQEITEDDGHNTQQCSSYNEVLQELKNEQQKREAAEKSLLELQTELDKKNKKVQSLSTKVGELHQKIKKVEDSQTQLMKELENQNQQPNKQEPATSLASEDLKETKLKLEEKISENRDLQDKLQQLQLHSEALSEQKQQVEAQLAELKDRYIQELRLIIIEERQWRAEIDNDVESLKTDLEKKQNEHCAVQPESESMTHEGEESELEEELTDVEES